MRKRVSVIFHLEVFRFFAGARAFDATEAPLFFALLELFDAFSLSASIPARQLLSRIVPKEPVGTLAPNFFADSLTACWVANRRLRFSAFTAPNLAPRAWKKSFQSSFFFPTLSLADAAPGFLTSTACLAAILMWIPFSCPWSFATFVSRFRILSPNSFSSSFLMSLVRSLVSSFLISLVRSLVSSFLMSLVRSLVSSFLISLVRSLVSSFLMSLVRSLVSSTRRCCMAVARSPCETFEVGLRDLFVSATFAPFDLAALPTELTMESRCLPPSRQPTKNFSSIFGVDHLPGGDPDVDPVQLPLEFCDLCLKIGDPEKEI